MFEQRPPSKSPAWKYLPIAGGIFLVLVGLAIYFSGIRHHEPEEITGVLRADDPDFKWYRQYVELKDPKLSMSLNLAGKRMVTLAGVIENYGEKTLDVVEIKVVFFNYETPVWETERMPIQPGPYTPPIRPLTKRSVTFFVEDIPENWLAGHAEMSIHGFRFLEDGKRERQE